jgi:hypothetical protein
MEATVMIVPLTLGTLPFDVPPAIVIPGSIPAQLPSLRFTYVIPTAEDSSTSEVGRFDTHFSKLKALRADQSLWPEDAEPPSDIAMAWAHAIIQQLQADDLLPTRVVASAEGGIGICFVAGNKYADIECLNSGAILGVISNRRNRPCVWEVEQIARGFTQASERLREFLLESKTPANVSSRSTRR